MEWTSIFSEIIKGLIGIALTALGGIVAALINRYIKNEQAKDAIANLHELVHNAVLETYQVYVEELKDRNIFDERAQKTALASCLRTIKENMPAAVEKWLRGQYEDVDAYLTGRIEAMIGELKNNAHK